MESSGHVCQCTAVRALQHHRVPIWIRFLLSVNALLQAFLAERMVAFQNHGIFELVEANGALEVVPDRLRAWQRSWLRGRHLSAIAREGRTVRMRVAKEQLIKTR